MLKKYKTIREIGKGGMATVFLAQQAGTGRQVAVKILKTDTIKDKEYIKRFFREARITAKLDHPNIIKVIESNYSGKQFYIVTEYIEGGDFYDLLKDRDVDILTKLTVLLKVVAALDYAHGEGIVHRDIKPSNILLTKELEPRLCDFGIATALWGQETRLTQTFEIIGTLDYIAPEQRENSKTVDFRADLYSLGVILYEVITGRKPQGAFARPIEHNPSIPRQLDDLVMKCLQPFAYKRYKSTRNLYTQLQDVLKTLEEVQPPRFIPLPPAPTRATGVPGTGPPNTNRDSRTIKLQSDEPDFDDVVMELRNGSLPRKLYLKNRFLALVHPGREEDLIQLLSTSEGVLKETAIEALGEIKSTKSCPYLIELLIDPYYNKMAAAAIGEIGCQEAEFKLFNILISNSENAYIALTPLGKLNSVKSVKDMARFLKSPHQWIRALALDALALITPGNEVREYIETASIQDSSADIRARAKKLLWRIKE